MPADLTNPSYPFDPTGKKVSNKITGEQQVLTSANYRDYHYIVPSLAPFFAESLRVTFKSLQNEVRTLVQGVDYICTHWFIAASRACSAPIYGSISFLDLQLTGTISLDYQTLGGIWLQDETAISQVLADRLHNPRITAWDVVVDMPVTFPVIDHEWDLVDLVGASDIVSKLEDIGAAILSSQTTGLTAHMNNIANPHQVTAHQAGTYTAAEIDAKFAAVNARIDALA